jgi:hypothetical protein
MGMTGAGWRCRAAVLRVPRIVGGRLVRVVEGWPRCGRRLRRGHRPRAKWLGAAGAASGAAGQPGRDVQQPVAQGFGFGCGQFSGQREQPQQAVRSAAIAVAVSQAWLIW